MKENNLKIAVKVCTPIILIVLSIFFMSYGNTKNHPSINGFIVESFLKKDLIDMQNKNQNSLKCRTCNTKYILSEKDFNDIINSKENENQ